MVSKTITFFDCFVSHLFINCPNVLLQEGFVQSLFCCDLTLKYVMISDFYLVKSDEQL